jgi:hypothetical protein
LVRTGAYAAAGTADALGPDDAGAGSKVGTFSLVFAEVGEVAEIPEVGVEHLSPFSRSMR